MDTRAARFTCLPVDPASLEPLTRDWHHAARIACFPGDGCQLSGSPTDTAMGIELASDGLVAVGALHPVASGEACLSLAVQPEFWDEKFVEELIRSLTDAAIGQGRLRLRTQVPLEATHCLEIFKAAGLRAASAVVLGGSTELEFDLG